MTSPAGPGSVLEELRHSLRALCDLRPEDPLWAAHLGLILTAFARRIDELERRLDEERQP